MYRWLKWAALTLAALVLLAAGGALAVRFFLSSDQMKRLAETQGRILLGRKVTVETLSIGLFSIEAGGLTVAGGPAEPVPLLKVAQVQVLLNPAALLYRRVSLLKVTLDGVAASAYRDSAGRFSFQDILDRLGVPPAARAPGRGGALALLSAGEAEAQEPKEAQGPKGESAGFDVVVRSLEMRSVRLAFASAPVGGAPAYRAACSFASIQGGGIRLGAPLNLTAEGSCTEPGLIRFTAGLFADFAGGQYSGWAAADPFEVAPFFRLAPAPGDVRALKGTVGGKAAGSYSGGVLEWDASLRARDLSGEMRPGPQDAWREVSLPAASAASKGRFDWNAGSGQVTLLEVELPFGKGRLGEPAAWNAAGRDEIHLLADISDVAGASRWAADLFRMSPPQLTRTGKLSLDLRMSRGRGPGQGLAVRAVAAFDPLDIAPLAAWVAVLGTAPLEGFEPQRGVLGGKIEASWSGENTVRWKLDLKAEDFGFRVRGGQGQPWRPAHIARAGVRTEGRVDIAREEAEVERLEIELPFAEGRLLEKGGWNLGGRDHLKLRVQVADSGALFRLVRDLTGMRVGDPGQGGKAEAEVAFSRARAEKRVAASVRGRLDPVDLSILTRLAPMPAMVKGLGGLAGGSFEVDYATGRPVRWKADLSGRALTAQIEPTPNSTWRWVELASLGLASEGWYDPAADAAEVARLEARLPFGSFKLNKPARWNVKGTDEIDLRLAIDDLGAAEVWVGSIVNLPVQVSQQKETLTASLTASRARAREKEFGWAVDMRFDPLEAAPLVQLWLEASPTLSGAGGEIGGKLSVTYSPAGSVRWEADLRGEGVWVTPRAPRKEDEVLVPVGKTALRSRGGYDIRRGSAEVAGLDAEFPFGSIRVPRPSVWNLKGRDELHLSWQFSDLGPALAVAGAVAGEPIPGLQLTGASSGSLALSRDRAKPASLAARGGASLDVRKVRLADYPNLETEVRGKADLDGKEARLALGRVLVRDLARPQDPPAVLLEGLAGAFGQADLMLGRVASSRIAANSLTVHFFMDPENRSTFDSLTERKGGPSPAAPKPQEAKPAPPPPAPPAPRPRRDPAPSNPYDESGMRSPRPPAPASRADKRPLPPERPNEDLPDIRVGRLEIERVGFHFRHEVEKGKPPAVADRRGMRLTAENVDTRMPPGRMDTRLRLEEPGQPAPLLFEGRANLGVRPFPAAGNLTLRKYDLKPLSPYARQVRGAEIERGEMDVDAAFTLRREYLQAEAKGKVYNLSLRPVGKRHLATKAQEVAEGVALDLLKRRTGEIPISVRIQGRLDDPRTTIYGLAMDSLLVGVFAKVIDLAGAPIRGLGGGVADILRGVIEGFGVPLPPKSPPAPESKASPPAPAAPAPATPAPPEAQPEPPREQKRPDLKQLERDLKKGLKDFLRR